MANQMTCGVASRLRSYFPLRFLNKFNRIIMRVNIFITLKVSFQV
jgi:hypothetical protein